MVTREANDNSTFLGILIVYYLVIIAIIGVIVIITIGPPPPEINEKDDAWFFELKSQLLDQYDFIESVDVGMGRRDMNISIIYKDAVDIETFDSIFYDIMEKTFLNPEGNPSLKSYELRRPGTLYREFYVYFVDVEKPDLAKVVYYSEGNNGYEDEFCVSCLEDDDYTNWNAKMYGEEQYEVIQRWNIKIK